MTASVTHDPLHATSRAIVRLDYASTSTSAARYRATVARVGPLDYHDHVEHVPRSTLADSASQLVGLPVTLGHTDDGSLTPPEEIIVGRVVSASMDGDAVVATIEIHDDGARRAIDDGRLVELSPAYTADVETIPDGRHVQTRRDYRGGHVALLPPRAGRCGAACSVHGRADHRSPRSTNGNNGAIMSTITRSRLDALRTANRATLDAYARGEGFAVRRERTDGFAVSLADVAPADRLDATDDDEERDDDRETCSCEDPRVCSCDLPPGHTRDSTGRIVADARLFSPPEASGLSPLAQTRASNREFAHGDGWRSGFAHSVDR